MSPIVPSWLVVPVLGIAACGAAEQAATESAASETTVETPTICAPTEEEGRAAVFVAAGDLATGTTVREALELGLVECRLIPTDFRADNAVTDLSGREDWTATANRTVGQVILDDTFAEPP